MIVVNYLGFPLLPQDQQQSRDVGRGHSRSPSVSWLVSAVGSKPSPGSWLGDQTSTLIQQILSTPGAGNTFQIGFYYCQVIKFNHLYVNPCSEALPKVNFQPTYQGTKLFLFIRVQLGQLILSCIISNMKITTVIHATPSPDFSCSSS